MAIKRITTNLIKDSDIATVDIANNAITAAKITDGNITTAKLADLSVTAGKLAGTLDLTGKTITVATATTGDSDTSPASTAFVQQEIAALVDSSPSSLNTLNELAAALGDDASFSTTVTNSIATKLPLAGGTMTGDLKIVNSSGATLDINSNASAADSKILLHEGTSASPANGASIRYDGVNNLFKIGVGSSVDTTRLTIVRDTGNVGIGNTPNAAFKLDVEGAVRTNGSGFYVSSNYSSTNNVYKIYENSNEFRIESQIFGNANAASSPIVFATSNTDGRLARMTIDNTGNVGIGTDSPDTMLHLSAGSTGVAGGGDAAITMTNKFDNPDNSWKIAPVRSGVSNTGLEIRDVTDSRTDMVFDGTGKVGIGTSSPSKMLHVNGELQIENNLTLNENTPAIVIPNGDLRLFTGGTESMRLDSSGNVGINEISPDYKLHITGSGSAAQMQIESTSNSNAQLIFRNTASAGSGVTGGFHIGLLGDTTGDGLIYHHHDKPIRFYTNAANTMTLTGEDGMLHLNGRSGSYGYAVPQDQALGYTNNLNAGAFGILHRDSYDSYVTGNAYYYKTGGSSGWRAKYGAYKSTVMGMVNGAFTFDCSSAAPGSNGASVSGLAARVRIDSDGLKFGSDTAAANALDDYEEGTWTPIVQGGTTTGTGTYSTQSGTYRRIGSMVHITCRVEITNHTGTGHINITGLPFSATTGNETAFNLMYNNLNTSTGYQDLAFHLGTAGNTGTLFQSGDSAGWTTVPMDTSFGIIFNGTYTA